MSMIAAARLGGVLLLAGAGAAMAQPASPLAGRYEGGFDGGSGSITISGAPPRLHVTATMSGDNCSGDLDGPATVDAKGRVILLGKERDVFDHQCRLTMTPVGANGLKVQEEGCGYYHSMSCEFSADEPLVRRGSRTRAR